MRTFRVGCDLSKLRIEQKLLGRGPVDDVHVDGLDGGVHEKGYKDSDHQDGANASRSGFVVALLLEA